MDIQELLEKAMKLYPVNAQYKETENTYSKIRRSGIFKDEGFEGLCYFNPSIMKGKMKNFDITKGQITDGNGGTVWKNGK